MIKSRRVIGILGGMGPEATVELMRRIILATPAKDDDDHIHMIVDNNPQVPSRIKALIEKTGDDPAPELIRMAKRLEAAGADALAIACNTAHYYADRIQDHISIPLLDMIRATAKAIKTRVPAGSSVGLLASPAVVDLGLYHRAFTECGLRTVVPAQQDRLLDVIKSVKRGDTSAAVKHEFRFLSQSVLDEGAAKLVIACTELSVIADAIADLPVLDALDVLTKDIIAFCRPEQSEIYS